MRIKQSAISKSNVAGVVAGLGIILFTILLLLEKISQSTYVILLGLLAVVSVVLYDYPRVRKLDLKNFKIVLDPVAEIKPGSYQDEVTGNKIGISVSSYYSIVKVNDREYYFNRETGEFDGFADPVE